MISDDGVATHDDVSSRYARAVAGPGALLRAAWQVPVLFLHALAHGEHGVPALDEGARVAALEDCVTHDIPIGVLAYLDGEPVGWCSIAPRDTYAALERYRALPRLDDQPVWSVVCFFVDAHVRRQGVTLGLLTAAVDYAVARGARIVEGYPVEPGARLYTYMGAPSTFRAAGFRDVTPPGQARQVMRYVVGEV